MKRKTKARKARVFHVSFQDKGAEVIVVPANAFVSLFSGGLLVKQGSRQLAYIPNVHSFWELGSISFHPSTLGQSQHEKDSATPIGDYTGGLKQQQQQLQTIANKLPVWMRQQFAYSTHAIIGTEAPVHTVKPVE